MKTDAELMMDFKAGDTAAFEMLVRRHEVGLVNFFYRLLWDRAAAEDQTQEVFLRLFTHVAEYEPRAKFTTYLYRVITRLCIDRSRKKQPVYTNDLPACGTPTSSPVEAAERRERDAVVRAALARLPGSQRMAVVLRYYEGLSGAEIAAAMGTSVRAVERLLARGRTGLEQELADFLGK